MIIGKRWGELREHKKFSQAETEKRAGLLRCYISRVENGRTVPAVETLERFAHALEIPLYQPFYEGEEPPKVQCFPKHKAGADIAWGISGKDARLLALFCCLLSRADEDDR